MKSNKHLIQQNILENLMTSIPKLDKQIYAYEKSKFEALQTYSLVEERKCRQIRGSLFGSIFIKFKCEVAQYAAESECYCAPL